MYEYEYIKYIHATGMNKNGINYNIVYYFLKLNRKSEMN